MLFLVDAPKHAHFHKRSALGEHAAEREGKHSPLLAGCFEDRWSNFTDQEFYDLGRRFRK